LILKKIEFKATSDVILPRSIPILEEVAATLVANPQLRRIRVEGHTDNGGDDGDNMRISRRRAKSVVRWLVEVAKIDPARLEGKGCGESVPAADNRTWAGKEENRRVDFYIIDPTPPVADTRNLSKCRPAS
jgi:large repetitive protein